MTIYGVPQQGTHANLPFNLALRLCAKVNIVLRAVQHQHYDMLVVLPTAM